jgi:hypothetical protein
VSFGRTFVSRRSTLPSGATRNRSNDGVESHIEPSGASAMKEDDGAPRIGTGAPPSIETRTSCVWPTSPK